ncbi:MAG: class B sortase [Lachnospiraceae bacterium]|nr:class B sortase [Lachnospiraceae bacterium]
MQRRIIILLRFIFSALVVILAFSLIGYFRNERMSEDLRNLKVVSEARTLSGGELHLEAGEAATLNTIEKHSKGTESQDKFISEDMAEPEKKVLDEFAGLLTVNPDTIGWLRIPDTVIDYPVVSTSDEDYYLHHDFYGQKSIYGTLFVKDIADVDTPGTNIIIYGHHMRNDTMFGGLDAYESEDFFKSHEIIEFNTLYEERRYRVISVFRSEVLPDDSDKFRYYDFYQADSKEDFDYFYKNIKELSEYETGITADYGDTFITLSTCAYHTQNGRFVVVAKRIS